MSFHHSTEDWSIQPHPEHERLWQVGLSRAADQRFEQAFADMNAQRLSYVAFQRFAVADGLREVLGASFVEAINGILRDRATGGFELQVPGPLPDRDRSLLWATAVSHLVGLPNFDAMGEDYFAIFTVKDTDASDSVLRKAHLPLTLHTDGTYVDEPTDWVLMMKLQEQSVVGGHSTLLHLDDWDELERFAAHPMASAPIHYRGVASKRVANPTTRRSFTPTEQGWTISFIDQFARPDSMEQALYLRDLHQSLEGSSGVHAVPLAPGSLVLINNTFWLHGRQSFACHPQLERTMMRQRGAFPETRWRAGGG